MGCQACKGVQRSYDQSLREILKCIQNESTSSLNFFLKSLIRNSNKDREQIINSPSITLGSYKLSFLSYSLVAGSSKSFRFLYEKCGCSIELMNQNFTSINMSPLNILCEKNHSELLKYYLPIYFRYRNQSFSVVNTTLDFTNNVALKEPSDPFTPMQVAVLNGCITTVDILFNYNQAHPDPLININEVNEETGENCALISIRSGSLAMVKLVFEKYKLDFAVRNKCRETALQICAVSSAKHPNKNYDEIFIFLIEEVKVDPTDNYEEVLLVLDRQELVEYYENVLKGKGIKAKKQEIEEIFSSRRRVPVHIVPKTETKHIKESSDSSSLISSISKASYETPFNEGSFAANRAWLNGPN